MKVFEGNFEPSNNKKPTVMKRFLTLVAILVTMAFHGCCFFTKAGNSSLELTDISYEYELIYRDNLPTDCIGDLNISLSIPNDAKLIILWRTRGHLTEADRRPLLIATPFEVDTDSVMNLKLSNISWGTLFRVEARFGDSIPNMRSSIYDIEDFIAESDLKQIKEQAGVQYQEENNVAFSVVNSTLFIETQEDILVSIFNINGSILYSGRICGESEIPINEPICILRYILNNKVITKKIIMK
jgi:hypothetical protein